MEAKTVFVIALTTVRIVFPGLPTAFDLPEGRKEFGLPWTHTLEMSVWSDVAAPGDARAEVTVPEKLAVKSPVKLQIDRSEPPTQKSNVENPSQATSKVVLKTYWGCGTTVPEGQPRISEDVSVPIIVDYPKASLAFWPTGDGGGVGTEAVASGTYTLTTNYCGGTSVTLSDDQDFLPAVELINVGRKSDLEQAVRIHWKPVPRATGYLLSAVGGGEKDSVIWTSAARPDARMGLDDRVMTGSLVAEWIEQGLLLGPGVTSCTIPAGIFKGSSGAMLTLTAVGTDTAQEKDGIQTRVIIRSSVSVPLAGSYTPPESDSNR